MGVRFTPMEGKMSKNVIEVYEVEAQQFDAEKGQLKDVIVFRVVVNGEKIAPVYPSMMDIPFAKLLTRKMGRREARKPKTPAVPAAAPAAEG